jgi:Spy/CpxP family protein refolding chaperone
VWHILARYKRRCIKHLRKEGDMRTKRRGFLTGCCLLVAALGLQPALGQEQPQKPTGESQTAEDIHLTREMINNERQALVTKGMDLTPSEMQRFWPLYRQYRSETKKVGDRIVVLLTTYADNYPNMTDKVADKLLTEFVSIEQERARLKARYLPKFKKVLPPKKVARFYQIENKLDTTILAELAQVVPLTR